MNKEKMVQVKNRSASQVIYTVGELGIRREFAPGETKKIPFDELEKLSWQAGGRELMASFLQLGEVEVLEELSIPTEVEYYMNEEQIIELLLHGDYDAYLDCLQFAPTGVIDLIKTFAIELPLTDTIKIEALKERTGFDVIQALANKKADEEPEVAETKEEAPAQKAKPATNGRRRTDVSYIKEENKEEATPVVTTPKYKVVSSN